MQCQTCIILSACVCRPPRRVTLAQPWCRAVGEASFCHLTRTGAQDSASVIASVRHQQAGRGLAQLASGAAVQLPHRGGSASFARPMLQIGPAIVLARIAVATLEGIGCHRKGWETRRLRLCTTAVIADAVTVFSLSSIKLVVWAQSFPGGFCRKAWGQFPCCSVRGSFPQGLPGLICFESFSHGFQVGSPQGSPGPGVI